MSAPVVGPTCVDRKCAVDEELVAIRKTACAAEHVLRMAAASGTVTPPLPSLHHTCCTQVLRYFPHYPRVFAALKKFAREQVG